MTFHYLDACTIAGWSCSASSDPLPIDVACATAVGALVADAGAVLGVSELTLVEVHDTLSKMLRSTDRPLYDVAWFELSISRTMALIATERLLVISPPPKATEHAMVLVTVASRDHGAKLKAWDATHIITAAGWARTLGQRVEVVTADHDFGNFFRLQGHFGSLLDLRQVEA